jgi:hypothetical protein
MNGCFKYSYFPTAWKQANVIPILKPGKDPSDPKSYRPINLFNALSKILEMLLLHRLKSHVAEHRINLNEHSQKICFPLITIYLNIVYYTIFKYSTLYLSIYCN